MMTDQGRFAILNCRSELGVLGISGEATHQRRLAKTARRTRKPDAKVRAGIDPAFGAHAFVYDESSDTYRCPAGQGLRFRCYSLKRHNKKYRQYQAKGPD